MGTPPGPQGMMASSPGGQQGPLSPPRGHLGSMPPGMLPLSGPPMHPYMGYYPSPYFPAQSPGEDAHHTLQPRAAAVCSAMSKASASFQKHGLDLLQSQDGHM